jgi:hypothetical protein
LTSVSLNTLNLFSENSSNELATEIFGSIDKLNQRYGRETVFLGSSFQAVKRTGYALARLRISNRFPKFSVPSLGVVN